MGALSVDQLALVIAEEIQRDLAEQSLTGRSPLSTRAISSQR
jgi:hypothetical protein